MLHVQDRLPVEEHLERKAWREEGKVRLDHLDQGGDHLRVVVRAGATDEQVDRLDPLIPQIPSVHVHSPPSGQSRTDSEWRPLR